MISDSEATAIRVETSIGWARSSWTHRDVLHRPGVMYLDPDVLAAPGTRRKQHEAAPDRVQLDRLGRGLGFNRSIPLGPPTNLGVVGHSWVHVPSPESRRGAR